MKIAAMMRWVGPAAIAGGVFLVFSDLSGLPITIPYLSTASPSGFDAVVTGVILIALTLLLVGMAGLYARRPAPDAARVVEQGGAFEAAASQPVTEEAEHEEVVEVAEAQATRSSRASALVLGAGLVVFFLLRQ